MSELKKIRESSLLDLIMAVQLVLELYKEAAKYIPPTQEEINRITYINKLVQQSMEAFEKDNL